MFAEAFHSDILLHIIHDRLCVLAVLPGMLVDDVWLKLDESFYCFLVDFSVLRRTTLLSPSTMNQELESFKALTPVGPKPGVQRPMLLRGKAAKRIKAEKSAVLCKSEIDANLLAFQLMKNAMAEEAKSAGEDYLLYESGDDSLDEMDDEVLSLGGQSESEEEEGDLVHLAYNFAKGAIGQGVDIDFAKAIHDASEEIATCKDFVDISELSEAEDVEDLRVNEAAASGREGAAGGEELELEDAAAQDTFYHILGMELCLWMCSLVCTVVCM